MANLPYIDGFFYYSTVPSYIALSLPIIKTTKIPAKSRDSY